MGKGKDGKGKGDAKGDAKEAKGSSKGKSGKSGKSKEKAPEPSKGKGKGGWEMPGDAGMLSDGEIHFESKTFERFSNIFKHSFEKLTKLTRLVLSAWILFINFSGNEGRRKMSMKSPPRERAKAEQCWTYSFGTIVKTISWENCALAPWLCRQGQGQEQRLQRRRSSFEAKRALHLLRVRIQYSSQITHKLPLKKLSPMMKQVFHV